LMRGENGKWQDRYGGGGGGAVAHSVLPVGSCMSATRWSRANDVCPSRHISDVMYPICKGGGVWSCAALELTRDAALYIHTQHTQASHTNIRGCAALHTQTPLMHMYTHTHTHTHTTQAHDVTRHARAHSSPAAQQCSRRETRPNDP